MNRTRGGVLAAIALLVLAGVAVGISGPALADRGDLVSDGPSDRAGDGSADRSPDLPPPNSQDDGQVNGTAGADGTADGDDDLPPGVTEAGVSNASALVAAHRQALAESGYRFVLETNLSSGFAGGVEQWAVQNGSVEAGLSPFRFHTVSRLVFENESASPPPSVTDAWGNDSAVAVRTTTGNVSQVQRVARGAGGELRLESGGPGTDGDRPVALSSLLTQSTVVETVLRGGEFEVTDVGEVTGSTLVTLRATSPNPSAFGTDRTVSDFDATLVVDEAGAVRQLDYELSFERGDGPAVRYRYRVTDIGAVSVEEPPWVSESFESAGATGSTGVVVAPGPVVRPAG